MRAASYHRRLSIERLEDRRLLAVDSPGAARNGIAGFQDWYFDLNHDPVAEIDRVFGLNTDTVTVSGDWNGDGKSDIGIVRQENGFWRWLLDTNGDPTPDLNFVFGLSTDKIVVGDWDGNGTSNAGVARVDGGLLRWLYDTNNDPNVEAGNFLYGFSTDTPVTGDWDNNGTTNAGVARQQGSFWLWLYDTNQDPNFEFGNFLFGLATDTPITGDWDGVNGTDAGITRPEAGLRHWYVDTNRDPTSESDFVFGATSDHLMSGHWGFSELSVGVDGGAAVQSGTTTLNFGSGVSPDPPITHTIQVANIGNAPLSLTALAVPNGFTVQNFPGTVPPFTIQNVQITLTSAVADGILSFVTNDGNEAVFEFNLHAIRPEIQAYFPTAANPIQQGASVYLGASPVGTTGQGQIILFNSGDGVLSLGSAVFTGPFGSSSVPSQIQPHQYVNVPINFNSALPGSLSGSLSISTNDADENPFFINLTAIAFVPMPEIVVDDVADAGSANIGSGVVNDTIHRTFTIRNHGTAALILSPPTLTGPFSVEGPFLTSIPIGGNAQFTILANSTTAGTKSGTISFNNNDADENPYNFALSAAVNTPVPAVDVIVGTTPVVDGGTVTFDPVTIGGTGQRVFTVRNSGTATLSLATPTVSGPFSVVGPFPTSISRGGSANFILAVNTSAVGAKTGNISFGTNVSLKNPYNFALSAVVTPPPQPEIDLVDANNSNLHIQDNGSLDLGSTIANGANLTKTVTIKNTGTGTLVLGSPTISAPFSVVGAFPTTIAGGHAANFTIRVDTSTGGEKTGSISFATNDTDEAVFNFSLTAEVSRRVYRHDYLSFESGAVLHNSDNSNTLSVDSRDIVHLREFNDGSYDYQLFFDGSAAGLNNAIDDFDLTSSSSFQFTIRGTGNVPGLGTVKPGEFLAYSAASQTFSFVYNHTAIRTDNVAQFEVDAYDQQGYSLATRERLIGPYSPPLVEIDDSDIFRTAQIFTHYDSVPQALASYVFIHASGFGLNPDNESADIDALAGSSLISTRGTVTVGTFTAHPSDMFSTSGLFFDASEFGIGDGINLTGYDYANGGEVVATSTFGAGDADYGDAPASYGDAANAAVGPTLGLTRDTEPDSQYDPNAEGDDIDTFFFTVDDQVSDDDDGIQLLSPLTAGMAAQLAVSVGGDNGYVSAWVDWNADGDFLDAGENVIANAILDVGDHVLDFAVPANAATNISTYARFRISSDPGTPAFGIAFSGEVEDYKVMVSSAPALVQGDYDGDGAVDGADILLWQTQFGSQVALRTQSDGNGDGVVNVADLPQWSGSYGQPGVGSGASVNDETSRDQELSTIAARDMVFERGTADYAIAFVVSNNHASTNAEIAQPMFKPHRKQESRRNFFVPHSLELHILESILDANRDHKPFDAHPYNSVFSDLANDADEPIVETSAPEIILELYFKRH